MTPERYQALLRWLEARPALKKLVIALNRWLPAVPFACYPLLLVLLNVRWFRLLSANRAAALDFMQLIARAVFVPAFVFLGGTLLRARLNFPRPYEQPGFTPLVPKETHGKSFPSRHALSAAVLAAVWCYFFPAAGACMVVVARPLSMSSVFLSAESRVSSAGSLRTSSENSRPGSTQAPCFWISTLSVASIWSERSVHLSSSVSPMASAYMPSSMPTEDLTPSAFETVATAALSSAVSTVKRICVPPWNG